MAVQLFLDGREVVVDSSKEIKVTRENPYFTLSDSYTLAVSLPLDIPRNRAFFGNAGRMEAGKAYREFACRLYCANRLLMDGTAYTVQSTETEVKVQLACGVSSLKMSGEQTGKYIDEIVTEEEGLPRRNLVSTLDLGLTYERFSYMDVGTGIDGNSREGWGFPVLDNSNGVVVNLADACYYDGQGCSYVSECPKLLDVAGVIASKLGYALDVSALPQACRSIYIVSATRGPLAMKLPHWTVKEFFTQFQNFFGCTLVQDVGRTLRLVPLDSFAQHPVTEISPVGEFQVEYSQEDDAEGVMNRNVEFQMNGSTTETVDETILAQAETTAEFDSIAAMMDAVSADSEAVRKRKIYKENGRLRIYWVYDDGTHAPDMKYVAPFNPLKRFDGAASVKLKISPVHIEEGKECTVMATHDWSSFLPYEHTVKLNLPSVSNPFKQQKADGTELEDYRVMQRLVEDGDAGAGKADTVSVAFFDGRANSAVATPVPDQEVQYIGGGSVVTEDMSLLGAQDKLFTIHEAFTDSDFKRRAAADRSKWSFSLNELKGYDFYLGQLHKLSFRCSHNVKHIFKFLSEEIPDPEDIFIVRGKRFACEKIEATIKDGETSRLMTGYFYEILS